MAKEKKVIFIVLILTVAMCLSGCYLHKEMYEPEEAERVAQIGTEMMQIWLKENMPDAVLEECTAYTAWTWYDGNDYLTDYASGKISHNGEQKTFTIHTVTGAVYFQMDDETRQKLEELVEAYFDEALASIGIVPESIAKGYQFNCYVMAPAQDGDSAKEVPQVSFFDFGLPAGVEDLEAFVRNPQLRLPIYIEKPEFFVSDTVDLSGYNLAAMETLEEESGLHIGSLVIKNGSQFFSKIDAKGQIKTTLREYGCWRKEDGFELYGLVRERNETRDGQANELTVSDVKYHPEKDLVFEQTEYGYRCSILNEEWPGEYSLALIAYEGAEILNYNFYCFDEEDYSSKKDLSEEGTETIWKESTDGSYVLVSASSQFSGLIHDGDILVRKEY